MSESKRRIFIQKQSFEGSDYTLISIFDLRTNDENPTHKFMLKETDGKQIYYYLPTNLSALVEIHN